MEYIEGETLADRLERGPLPLQEAIRFGIQISDAMDNAHSHGVVHRDLKPANIMLTPSGPKLLDFGIAKALSAKTGEAGSEGPTKAKPLTEEGVIFGTPQYMSPEQLQGKEADARSERRRGHSSGPAQLRARDRLKRGASGLEKGVADATGSVASP